MIKVEVSLEAAGLQLRVHPAQYCAGARLLTPLHSSLRISLSDYRSVCECNSLAKHGHGWLAFALHGIQQHHDRAETVPPCGLGSVSLMGIGKGSDKCTAMLYTGILATF